MLDVARSEEAMRISKMSALWESNVYPPIPANLDKFKKYLGADEIEIIETLTGDFMDRYGYQRMTAGKANISPQAVAAARVRSAARKVNAWTDLEQNDNRDYQLRRFRTDYLEMIARRNHRRGTVHPDFGSYPRSESPVKTIAAALMAPAQVFHP
jgi:hypothetical protein